MYDCVRSFLYRDGNAKLQTTLLDSYFIRNLLAAFIDVTCIKKKKKSAKMKNNK